VISSGNIESNTSRSSCCSSTPMTAGSQRLGTVTTLGMWCALYDGELLAWLDFMEGWWAIATQTSQGCIECRFLTVSLIHDPSLGLTNETGS
jgi:hypothetical protein